MSKKNDNTLIQNASFLMVAALISKIIGMLYKSPLSTTLGNESFALFQYAQNAYFILLMIASFSRQTPYRRLKLWHPPFSSPPSSACSEGISRRIRS